MLNLLIVLMTSTTGMARDILWTPQEFSQPKTLVVAIHGCFQNPRSFMKSSRWDELAKEKGFAVLYPGQRPGANPMNCWNWFEPENQKKQSGEPFQIVKKIQALKEGQGFERVYVAGISSGGAMVSQLISCYPQVFQAAMIHSGVSFGLARTPEQAAETLKNGPTPSWRKEPPDCRPESFRGGLFWVQGDSDRVVHGLNASQITKDFLSGTSSKTSEPAAGSGRYGFRKTSYLRDGKTVGVQMLVIGLGHAWSGGRAGEKFSDPKGPDVTRKAYDFMSGF